MNRFRTKKRAKDDASATPRASQDSESPAPFRLFGKGKKSQEEEPKKELDLEHALPSSDDFRTSLLMTGLSARFSMLREQDDPNTKIGKASDDSVLYPKRASRMDFDVAGRFGAGAGLSDIAEVESIRKDAPFARMDRMDSFHSSDGNSLSGSMMDRAKPGEGNNLFGGRQKIYKIAAGNASNKNVDGGMSHRALYDDDVAMSSFQKWRQTEKAKMSFDDDNDLAHSTSSLDLVRAESPPPMGYNRNRETNSTTSSTPSLGRNSTAATSVMSQPTSSVKDWQSTTTAPNSATGTPLLERSMTRTKRLYETGLNNELQEQQTSALSRMDTLSRQRGFGSRTPDLQSGPSPTSGIFAERFGDRRVLAKGSAPNLRSMSPPTAGSPIAPMDLGIRNQEAKPSFGGAPPLSPPISEGEEHSILPNDRGKATAMGMFQKPLHSYDESRYAQRQLQLQQGRETPTNRFRTESNASQTTGRSRSSSSAQRQPVERAEPVIQVEPTLKEEEAGSIYFNNGNEPNQRSPIATRRPADRDHPAFRDSALPTPLSLSSMEPSPVSDQPFTATAPLDQLNVPQDSPTLPSSAGLSGMVRAHLRTDSNTSSIYGSAPQTSTFASRFPLDPYDPSSFGVNSNPWEVSSPDWQSPTIPNFVEQTTNDKKELEGPKRQEPQQEQQAPTSAPAPAPVARENPSTEPAERNSGSSAEMEKEHDEFASQLASAQRRVRERLTSYVESDRDSRSLSRSLSPHSFERTREPSLSRPNPLGILRSKTSRGSLADRPNRENSQHAKAIKMLGLATSTISSAPSPNKSSFEEKEPDCLVRQERVRPDISRAESAPAQAPPQPPQEQPKVDESMHAGLRAFRQARKELQKLKDMESQRSPTSGSMPVIPGPMPGSSNGAIVGPPASCTVPSRERAPSTRSPSRERRPPPVTYQRTPIEEPQSGAGPGRNASRPPSRTERDRSGSEASNGERSHRPARLRTVSSPYEERGQALSPTGPPPRSPMMLSPGLPGTNIRRSPHMPPQPYPTASGPQPLDRSASSGSLAVHHRRRGPDSGQPSPVSPMAAMPSPSIPVSQSTPTFSPPRRQPSAPPVPSPVAETAPINRLDESMKRVVKKKDISEPTFVSSTSRVATVALPETSEGRSRSYSRSRSGSILGAAASAPNLHAHADVNAPPVPPINPKRRNMIGSIIGRKGEEDMGGASTPYLPLAPPPIPSENSGDRTSAFSLSDDEDDPGQRRRLRKTISEANGMNVRDRLNQGPSPPNVGTPTAMTSGAHNSALPGGMI